MRLIDVDPADSDWIVTSLGRWACTDRWSAPWAHTPSPHMLMNLLWHDVPLQKVAVDPSGTRQALFQVTSPNLRDGHAYLELLCDPDATDEWDPMLARFVDGVFDQMPLRKLCLAVAEDDLVMPPALARAEPIGIMRDHRRRGRGRYADVNLYELWSP